MRSKSLDFSPEFSNYVPEHKDQRIVVTPYGKGIIIRTRENDSVNQNPPLMHEIELGNWMECKLESRKEVSSSSSKIQMLYSPINYPSVLPVVGSDVLTQWGKGKVTEIRDDDRQTHVVKLSSWRLANRSSVFCYLSAKECEVIKPYRIYDMDVFEKVEYANDLKQQATAKFKDKDYTGALEMFAKAIDAVRYVQHGAHSTNELRADLVVVMITCSNNAALCSSKKGDWERVAKFGQNALVLIEALEEKGHKSKIKKVLNRDGIGDSQLFGTWKVKSLLLIATSQMERHDTTKMTKTLKKALEAISLYKKENDSMYKQLSVQEKDIRRLRSEFSKKAKTTLIKEKKRARAMFGADSQDSIPPPGSISSSLENLSTPKIALDNAPAAGSDEGLAARKTSYSSEKENSTAVESEVAPALEDSREKEEEEDDYSEAKFFEEHGEALLILSGIFIGWLVVKMTTKKR